MSDGSLGVTYLIRSSSAFETSTRSHANTMMAITGPLLESASTGRVGTRFIDKATAKRTFTISSNI